MKSRSIGGVAAAGCADAAAEVVADEDVGADGAAAVVGMGATEGVGFEMLAGARGGATGAGTGSSCG